MDGMQEEEIESLRAIFCKDDEFIVKRDTDGQLITVNFDLGSMTDDEVDKKSPNGSVSIFLTPEYPQTQRPKITIRCPYLPVAALETITQRLEEMAATLQGQPMLLDLCCLSQEVLEREIKTFRSSVDKSQCNGMASQTNTPGVILESHLQKQKLSNTVSEVPSILPDLNLKASNSKLEDRSLETCQLKDMKTTYNKQVPNSKHQNICRTESDSKFMTGLLQLDHMRSKNNYIKLIKKWISELGLAGRLIFCNKLILILLQGTSQAIREYIIMNRTTVVDVDSKGRACKERMLAVLCEVPGECHGRLSDFCVEEIATFKSLQEFFDTNSMQDLYQNYVSNLIPFSGSRVTSCKPHK